MIPRTEVIGRLRAADFRFDQPGKHTEIYRRHGDAQRVAVPKRDLLLEQEASTILAQAGLTKGEVEAFLKGCLKG